MSEISSLMKQDIIDLRRDGVDIINPEDTLKLNNGDDILFLELKPENEDWDEVQTTPKKFIIIDDNPVIIRLYARLFQKADFHPLTAMDG